MREGYRIIDADRHVTEPIDMWRKYLDPEFRDHAPYLDYIGPRESPLERLERLGPRGMVPATPALMVVGQPVMHKLSERAQIELALAAQRRSGDVAAGASPQAQLRAMDEAGIDVSFLFPTFASYLVSIDTIDPRLAGAFARAYNRWLHDYCRTSPDRLRGVGLISLHDPAGMMEELEHVVELGWKGVVLRPNPARGRTLAHPAYEPFWGECERCGIAIVIHEGTHARLPTAGADRFETRFALHACSHPMEQMMALLTLIEGGVLERHPDLRVAFLEAGCGWLPYWLWRLDEVEYRHMAGEVEENVRMAPSVYFRRQCFVSAEPDEPLLAQHARFIGEDLLLFGTDFPHLDHEGDVVGQVLALRGELGQVGLEKMLWKNAERFFGLE
ncbi:amidohydrolase family protein [Sorangium sp. So ce134]